MAAHDHPLFTRLYEVITSVVAVEPSDSMRAAAQHRVEAVAELGGIGLPVGGVLINGGSSTGR